MIDIIGVSQLVPGGILKKVPFEEIFGRRGEGWCFTKGNVREGLFARYYDAQSASQGEGCECRCGVNVCVCTSLMLLNVNNCVVNCQ